MNDKKIFTLQWTKWIVCYVTVKITWCHCPYSLTTKPCAAFIRCMHSWGESWRVAHHHANRFCFCFLIILYTISFTPHLGSAEWHQAPPGLVIQYLGRRWRAWTFPLLSWRPTSAWQPLLLHSRRPTFRPPMTRTKTLKPLLIKYRR